MSLTTSHPAPALAAPSAVSGAAAISVTTSMAFRAPPMRAWDAIIFYEQLDERPPWYLRLLLPVPLGTEGRKSEVGDEALCRYEGGHLVKRVTAVERGRLYGFDVARQELDVGGGMRLLGGAYSLRALPDGWTEVEAVTRYASPRWPRALWAPLEAFVCHAFHRHILRAMRRVAEGR